jgi:UDP-glucose 4-epimerase
VHLIQKKTGITKYENQNILQAMIMRGKINQVTMQYFNVAAALPKHANSNSAFT